MGAHHHIMLIFRNKRATFAKMRNKSQILNHIMKLGNLRHERGQSFHTLDSSNIL